MYVQGICYSEEQLELEAAAVSRAALQSKQEPIGMCMNVTCMYNVCVPCWTCTHVPSGIMLLEKQLLVNSSAGSRPPPAKRARGGAGVKQPPAEDTVVWVELSKCVDHVSYGSS